MVTHKDLVLLQRVQQGDREALGELYDEFGGALYGIALGVLNGDEEAAQQVFQLVFVKIRNGASAYDPAKGSPFFWMITIARSLALDHLRATDKDAWAQPLPLHRHQLAGVGAQPAMRQPHPAARLDHPIDQRAEQRSVLAMAWHKGWSQQRTADHLGLSLPIVRAHLRAALMELRDRVPTNG